MAMAAQLRKVAADGPVRTMLDGRLVAIELHGHKIIEHPRSDDAENEPVIA